MYDHPEIKDMLHEILFRGVRYSFEIDNPSISVGVMFGFVKEEENAVMIANRLFETKMYNLFLSEAELDGRHKGNPVGWEENRGNCCMRYNRKRIGNSCVGKFM